MVAPSTPASDGTPIVKEKIHTGKVVGIAIIAALGGLLFGYDSAVVNGANKGLYYFFSLENTTLQGFVTAIALIGSAVGAFVGGRLADKLGRKKVMLIAAICFLVAALGQGIPFGLADFIFWRVLGGFAIGLAAVISPMYISEVAPAHLRGRLSSLFQLAIVLGIFLTQIVNQVIINLVPAEPNASLTPHGTLLPQGTNNTLWLGFEAWQWMFLAMVIPAAIYFLLALTVPESPRFLVSRGKEKEAETVLGSIYVESAAEKVDTIKASLSGEHKSSMSDIKGSGFLGLMPIVWVGIILAIFQQFVGINAVFYYQNLIWAAVGFQESQAFATATIVSAVNVLFTFVAIAFIDKLGRKLLLLIGSAGMFVTLGALMIIFMTAEKCTQTLIDAGTNAACTTADQINNPLLSSSTGMIAVVMLCTYVAFFAATWGPILWVMLGEMFSNKIRGAAMSLGVMTNWIANFIVSQSFPTLVGFSLGLAYGIFTVCAFLSFFYVLKFVKETKGVELENMEALEGADAK